MGLPFGLLMLILAAVGYSSSSYNTTQTTDSTLTFIPASNEKTDSEYRCNEQPIHGPDRRPLAADCVLSIGRLPDEDTEELFHVGGDAGIYQLPWILTTFDCRLTVDIDRFFIADTYTWLGVKEAALYLTYACRDPIYPSRTGGWTMIGKLGRINISLAAPVFPTLVQSFRSNSSIGPTQIFVNGTATE
ncbi:hypothetical protein JMJ35_008757 [Cladonia borealis]|uniref:Ecp2 effector protein domain-containing protein n=1 Tax=Cladonia borealis TaxID=184061 RepID=A0AA39U5Z9_9LECA|nr:hypothetical protein JMJ35_008757 [Cladonia borealis]